MFSIQRFEMPSTLSWHHNKDFCTLGISVDLRTWLWSILSCFSWLFIQCVCYVHTFFLDNGHCSHMTHLWAPSNWESETRLGGRYVLPWKEVMQAWLIGRLIRVLCWQVTDKERVASMLPGARAAGDVAEHLADGRIFCWSSSQG